MSLVGVNALQIYRTFCAEGIQSILNYYFMFVLFSVLGIEATATCMLGKYSTNELHFQTLNYSILSNFTYISIFQRMYV